MVPFITGALCKASARPKATLGATEWIKLVLGIVWAELLPAINATGNKITNICNRVGGGVRMLTTFVLIFKALGEADTTLRRRKSVREGNTNWSLLLMGKLDQVSTSANYTLVVEPHRSNNLRIVLILGLCNKRFGA